MSNKSDNPEKIMFAIPGGACVGLGVGFFFFPVGVFGYTSVFAFTGCIILGVGIGFIMVALSKNRGSD
ncbi:MAG: hypothetical protein AB3N14_09800 [Flavobacteriaceae bacterium]